MRYSSALVLSTLAVGQAAAANIRHAGFHARRAAEQKREADLAAVNWKDVSYDLSNVDWSSVFATPTPTPTPEPSKAEVKVEAAEPTSVYTPPVAKTSEAAKPKETESSGNGGNGDILGGLVPFLKNMNVNVTEAEGNPGLMAPTSNNGRFWLNDDSAWKTTFINDGNDDIVVICWSHDTSEEQKWWMTINKYLPQLAFKLPSGQKQTVSFAEGVSGACGPAYPGTKLSFSGTLFQSWFEFTFTQKHGTFDLSKEVNMNGVDFEIKGSKCTSNGDQCVFKCKDGAASCWEAESYELLNCGAAIGGGAGKASDGGSSGGCMMGESSEHIKVTFN